MHKAYMQNFSSRSSDFFQMHVEGFESRSSRAKKMKKYVAEKFTGTYVFPVQDLLNPAEKSNDPGRFRAQKLQFSQSQFSVENLESLAENFSRRNFAVEGALPNHPLFSTGGHVCCPWHL